ncbi:oxidoreductase, Gfo/Idh/MocA family [Alkalibacterium sp. AK22]|uniref:Gfo/Idh/MocA family protein n=1 Tax=Alkalibacterium sp. AK22 TaxID=1229520 RepID=UPI00044D7523|nr:Gfo/Idh/MocA family oxidoreductase [Alkalibacterium sp. AK22]EXJ23110.1 oxidoreductase, Gfo/Idh/MocA family [Alkalibacterium sp. AK22]
MAALRLATIGTSMITKQFIEAAIESGRYTLEAVYSRSQVKAEEFKKAYRSKKAYTDLTQMLEDSEIDVVYIASPNSLHYPQAVEVLKHEKHAIVEKPMVTRSKDWDQLIKLAEKQGKVVVEAARHIYEPNFIHITQVIRTIPEVLGASLTYSKYSSRYDQVKSGEEPPIFSPRFAGGAANDLGIYVIYAAVAWFGEPKSVHAFSQQIKTGVDGKGTVVLRYDSFDVTLHYGKINTSMHSVEVYGEDRTLILDAVTGLSKASWLDACSKQVTPVELDSAAPNPLKWEAKAFADLIEEPSAPDNHSLKVRNQELSRTVHQILEDIRQQH